MFRNTLALLALLPTITFALESKVVSFGTPNDPMAVELKNDLFVDTGGQAYVQEGFVKGEKGGIWVKVPANSKRFKVDFFRVLISGSGAPNLEVFFQMQIGNDYAPGIGAEIENAASITPGPYWNDIPAKGLQRGLSCAKGGQLIGAAIEFTHDGLPSIARDQGPMVNIKANSLMAIPGGWKYSVEYGLTGNWILRVMGHEAKEEECK